MRAGIPVMGLVLLMGAGAVVVGQTHDHGAAAPAQPKAGSPPATSAGLRAGMMEEHRASDQKLDALLKAAEDARGDAKVSALTAVVAELVRQHKAMHEGMAGMMEHGGMPMGRGRGTQAP
jgi:hypothetical protein